MMRVERRKGDDELRIKNFELRIKNDGRKYFLFSARG